MDTEYNPIVHPSTGALVTVGIPYNIEWNRTNQETINFKLFTAQSGTKFTYTRFEFQLLDGNLDYYEWNLNPGIASGQNYVLRLNRDAISPTFAITNSASGLLTRFVTSVTKETTQPAKPPGTSTSGSGATSMSGATSGSGTINTSGTISTSVTIGGTTTGLVQTGTSDPPSGGGRGGLSPDAKIALGVGISFGVFAPLGVIVACLQLKKTSRSQNSDSIH
ncbi:hypothetical protein ABW20_dc0101011 [Dactylellina cionopaga]|nr:hypothetical protein ABW20_dc0101011 [Dactylellina cionopaga]